MKENLLKFGVLSKPHGVWGEVLIRLIPEYYGMKINSAWVFIKIEGRIVPFEVISSKERGNEAIIMKLDTIDSEYSAKIYQGLDIYMKPEDVLKPKKISKAEAGIYELISYTVIDKKHGNIGIIQKIIDIQQNPLLSVLNGEKDILIPLQKEFIISLDKKKKELHIEAPKGLIELYLN